MHKFEITNAEGGAAFQVMVKPNAEDNQLTGRADNIVQIDLMATAEHAAALGWKGSPWYRSSGATNKRAIESLKVVLRAIYGRRIAELVLGLVHTRKQTENPVCRRFKVYSKDLAISTAVAASAA